MVRVEGLCSCFVATCSASMHDRKYPTRIDDDEQRVKSNHFDSLHDSGGKFLTRSSSGKHNESEESDLLPPASGSSNTE